LNVALFALVSIQISQGGAMHTAFGKCTTIRLRPDVREKIAQLAEQEGNHESAVIRRALSAGLAVISDQKTEAGRVPVEAA